MTRRFALDASEPSSALVERSAESLRVTKDVDAVKYMVKSVEHSARAS
jgi:hypothetical protein